MDGKLQKFIAVVDNKSYTKAAQELRVSQPALSMAIKDLQRSLGVDLFERHGREVKVSSAGQIVYDAARDMASTLDGLRLKLAEQANKKPTLNLGMIDGMAELLFVHHDNFTLFSKQAHLSLTIDASRRLIDDVHRGKLDCAIITSQTDNLTPALEQSPLGHEPLMIVASTGVRNTKRSTDPLPYISYNEASTSHHIIIEELRKRAISHYPVLSSTSPEVMLRLCISGVGFAVLPYLLVRPYLESGQLRPLLRKNLSVINRPISVLTQKAQYRHPILRNFIDQAAIQLEQLDPTADLAKTSTGSYAKLKQNEDTDFPRTV